MLWPKNIVTSNLSGFIIFFVYYQKKRNFFGRSFDSYGTKKRRPKSNDAKRYTGSNDPIDSKKFFFQFLGKVLRWLWRCNSESCCLPFDVGPRPRPSSAATLNPHKNHKTFLKYASFWDSGLINYSIDFIHWIRYQKSQDEGIDPWPQPRRNLFKEIIKRFHEFFRYV